MKMANTNNEEHFLFKLDASVLAILESYFDNFDNANALKVTKDELEDAISSINNWDISFSPITNALHISGAGGFFNLEFKARQLYDFEDVSEPIEYNLDLNHYFEGARYYYSQRCNSEIRGKGQEGLYSYYFEDPNCVHYDDPYIFETGFIANGKRYETKRYVFKPEGVYIRDTSRDNDGHILHSNNYLDKEHLNYFTDKFFKEHDDKSNSSQEPPKKDTFDMNK